MVQLAKIHTIRSVWMESLWIV